LPRALFKGCCRPAQARKPPAPRHRQMRPQSPTAKRTRPPITRQLRNSPNKTGRRLLGGQAIHQTKPAADCPAAKKFTKQNRPPIARRPVCRRYVWLRRRS